MISDEQIYRYLLGDVVISEMYVSPIGEPHRKPDTAESFGLYILNDDGVIRWKDFGIAEQTEGNRAIDLVKYMRNVSYWEAKKIVEKEVRSAFFGKPQVTLKKGQRVQKGTLPFVQFSHDFKDFELEYWDRYQITFDDLKREWIYRLDSLKWIGQNEGRETVSTPEDPAFVYVFKRNPISWKIYRPLSAKKANKFRQWNIEGVIEGAHDLPEKTDLLIISGSTKDRTVIKKLNYHSINGTGEGSYVSFIKNKDKLKLLAKRIVVMHDADQAGAETSKVLAGHLGCEYRDMRGKLAGQKDFSDYVDKYKGNHSYKELNEIIKQEL